MRFQQIDIADEVSSSESQFNINDVSIMEFDSGSETGSPAGTPVIARIKDNYVSSPAASKVIARLKENNGIPCRKGLTSCDSKKDLTFQRGGPRCESPTDSRIRDLEKENRRLLDENMRLHKELQQAKMKQEQLKTRHQNDVKREKERQQREKEEMKEVLRVAVSSIQSRGPHIDILPELTKEELRLLKSIE
ncbi:unnamed protein product [Oikopleura dioica]|uniref:Uncharacterized protein n=1 Tax=Oikopleura dioica TaxID=34765 RepID=E4X9Q6_OIKDI|nr:unnamed protein product [Oikopleura dioica]